jgi:tetratricopeptide (TPR) repeat protein/predicted Ser/Thr protein kinase
MSAFKEKQLGDFVLEKKLGQGGMGEVYKARQISLDRVVAVKILPRSLAAQENFIERFQREAKAAANLIHPNVIQIYSIGVEAGTPYFAMEYVEGEDLQMRMKRAGRLSFEESVEIVAGVANALACAYEKGIVHRDIKPSNIMIDKNGVVKVMDFGLAKATQDGGSNLTQSGLIMGTPNYISPEQGKGETIDCRSDIYSLGVVFYELLTGALPFRADTPAALIYKHAFESPEPPTKLTPDVPPFLEEICLRMMAKEPKDRYPNPKALLADLNEFRRNPEYYLKGGKRRTPAITASGSGSSVFGSGVRAASGEAVRERSGVITQAGAGSASSFQRAPTVADETRTGGEETIVEAPLGGGRGGAKIAAGVAGVAAVLAAGWFFVLPALRGGGKMGSIGGIITTSRGKVIFPLSKLDGRIPKGVEGSIQSGLTESYLTFRDVEVDPGEYILVFKKRGYERLIRKFKVTPDGIEPPLESIKFEFEPSDELKRLFARAQDYFAQKQFREAIAQVKSVVETAPDYPGAEALLESCKKSIEENQALARKGQALSRERRWKDAMETLRKIPETAEEYVIAQSMIREAEYAVARLKQAAETFERHLSEGAFAEARATLSQIRELVPIDDLTTDQNEARVKEAERRFTDAKREYETGQYEPAREQLEALLKLCPRHADATRMLAHVRNKLEEKLGGEQRVANALEAGEKAFQAGDFQRAASEAERALLIQKGNPVAEALFARARAKLVEQEIAAEFARLDGYFREKKIFNLLERVDSSDKKAYEELQADLQAFFAAPIVVKESAHQDFKVALDGEEKAIVETKWALALEFPDARGSMPPVHAEISVLVPQRVKLRRGGTGWLFVSFEQAGEKNVH